MNTIRWDCLPPSRLTSGTSVIPEMTVGMPMTSPENVALPPRCSAYLLPEETMMKNVVCAAWIQLSEVHGYYNHDK
jgi:hypothetical protein